MASIDDWAAKAAEYIIAGEPLKRTDARVERYAAIIATFAEPLMKLLRESKRDHEMQCPAWIEELEPCRCGADAWNARVDAALYGEVQAKTSEPLAKAPRSPNDRPR